MRNRHVLTILAACTCLCAHATTATGTTAPDLSSRMVIDGLTNDFTPDEAVFGINSDGSAQEPDDDSAWGPNNDIHQIRVTWDRARLYLAGEGIIWENTMVIAIDVVADRGVSRMDSLNSWRRNAYFTEPDFQPDAFGCTWDRNTSPRLILQVQGSTVDDRVIGNGFQAAATFDRGATGRAVEFRVPWSTLFTYAGGIVVRDTVIDGVTDTLCFLPPHTSLRIAGFVTWGLDGTGGPDVAPNNTPGCSSDVGKPLVIDNFATIDVDRDGDGLPDMNVSPKARVVFYDVATSLRRSTWGKLKQLYR